MSAGGSTWCEHDDDCTHRPLRPGAPVHYVRESYGPDSSGGWWVPAPEREIRPRPGWRYAVAVGAVLMITAIIVIAALHAGQQAADSFGPLLPPVTPAPTPHPDGWTP